MKSHVLSFYYISRSNRKAQSCCQVAFMRHYFPSSIYNAVTALWGHAHLTILIMHTVFWQQSTHAFFRRSNFHFPVLKFAVNEPHSHSLLYLKMSIGRSTPTSFRLPDCSPPTYGTTTNIMNIPLTYTMVLQWIRPSPIVCFRTPKHVYRQEQCQYSPGCFRQDDLLDCSCLPIYGTTIEIMNFFCCTEAFQASCQWNSRANYFFITPVPSNDPIFQNLAISILQDMLEYISSATCQKSPESQLIVGKGKKALHAMCRTDHGGTLVQQESAYSFSPANSFSAFRFW